MKIAICGMRHGHICSIIREVKKSNLEIVGVAENNPSAAESFLQSANLTITHKTLEEMIQDVAFDLLVLGGVYADRGAAAIQGLHAHKHILADKPLCTSLEELETIKTLSLESGKSVFVALTLRYIPTIITARNLLLSQEIGEISNIHVSGLHPLLFRKGRPDWYFEKGRHGGTINDLMIHGVDAIEWMTGYSIAEVIAARAWNFEIPEYPFFQDCAQGMLRLKNSAGILFDTSYKSAQGHPSLWTFHFCGTGGELFFELSSPEITLQRHGEEEKKVLVETPSASLISDLLKEIKSEEPLNLTTKESLSSTQQTLAIQAAADSNKTHVII
jgi:predicted dehydrogenase